MRSSPPQASARIMNACHKRPSPNQSRRTRGQKELPRKRSMMRVRLLTQPTKSQVAGCLKVLGFTHPVVHRTAWPWQRVAEARGRMAVRRGMCGPTSLAWRRPFLRKGMQDRLVRPLSMTYCGRGSAHEVGVGGEGMRLRHRALCGMH